MSNLSKYAAAFSAAAVVLGAAAFTASGQGGKSPAVSVPEGVLPQVTQNVGSTRAGKAVEDAVKHYFLQMEGETAAQVFAATTERNKVNGRFVKRGTEREIQIQAEQLAAVDAITHGNNLDAKQKQLEARLTTETTAKVVFRGSAAVNGIAVLARPDQVPALEKLPGVIRVVEMDLHQEHAVTSVNFVGTRNFWNTAGINARGEGVGVAVIDSGIDFVHTAMGGPGGTTGYDLNRTSVAGDVPANTFPTSKVVWGYDFAGDNYNAGAAAGSPALTPVPDANPMCVGGSSFPGAAGHGAACASLIAGFGVNADGTTYTGSYDAAAPDIANLRVSPGIAPRAQLYAMRVFGNSGSSGLVAQAFDVTTALRIWQLSPNGTPLPAAIAALTPAATAPPRTPVVSVASLSLGSANGFFSPFDPSSVGAQNAAIAGLSVIISAGNSYDSYYIVGSPSVATATISVAATYNAQLPGGAASAPVNGGQPALNVPLFVGAAAAAITSAPTNLPATAAIYSRDPLADFQHTAGATLAAQLTCALRNSAGEPVSDPAGAPLNPPGGNPYIGRVVLIDRGVTGFHQKALAAARAQAAAVVIVNNRPGAAPGMAAAAGFPVLTIPVISVTQDDGATFSNTGVANTPPVRPNLTITLLPENPAAADVIADYSSRGPRRGDNRLKPDMAAPAENVTVMLAGTGDGVMSFNGTSSACPHVAGGMALLRQITNSAGAAPAYSQEELKALMLNMTQNDPAVGGVKYGMARIGTGRLTLNPIGGIPTALLMSTDADFPVSVSFGSVDVPVGTVATFDKTVRLVNKAGFSRTFNASILNTNMPPGVSYTFPDGNVVNVAANASTTFRVRLNADGAALRHAREGTVTSRQVLAVGPPATFVPRHFLSDAGANIVLTESNPPVPGLDGFVGGNRLRLAVHSIPRPVSSLSLTPTTVTLPGTTATTNLTLAGNSISTGVNTDTVANQVADIQSHAKVFELQYRKAAVEPDPFFRRAEILEVGVTSDFTRRGNPFDTATTNNQSTVLVFAVSTATDFNTPNSTDVDVQIQIDTNGDGIENFTLRSFAFSEASYGNGTNPSNMYLAATNPTGSGTLTSTGFFTNILAQAPTNMLNNNVVMLSVNAQRLGLTAGTSRFLYRVRTFWRGGLVNESPWISYDVARPGVDGSGPVANDPFLLNANSGGTVAVALNSVNFSANRSIGALAVFPHNAPGNRTQVILPAASARLFIANFSPSSGGPGTVVNITGSGFTGTTTVSFGGANAAFTLNSDTSITATVPVNAVTGTVKVTTAAGVATSRARFSVTSVNVTSVEQ